MKTVRLDPVMQFLLSLLAVSMWIALWNPHLSLYEKTVIAVYTLTVCFSIIVLWMKFEKKVEG